MMGAGVARVPFSFSRLGLIAQHAVREAVRQKVFGILLLLALTLVAGAQALRDFNFGAPELKFIADLGFGVIGLAGAVLTVTATAQLFFSELEHRTVQTLLARPVWRTEFVLGKYLGSAAVTAAFCAVLTLLLAVMLRSREAALLREFPESFPAESAVNFAWLGAMGLLVWLKLAVLGALTLLVASYARSQIFAVTTGFLIWVIGHLQYLVQESAARADSPLRRTLGAVLGRVLPNFQLFGEAGLAGAAGGVAWEYVGQVALYAAAYVAAACALAVFSFNRREL
jgi:ABC-type transport system involved in multi-copper enzyme maturation permease subunit